MTPAESLTQLATRFGTDKWGVHYYTPHYEQHFAPLRHLPINVLEIGIGGYEDPAKGGESLRMWEAFFPNARIYGIDLHDKQAHDGGRIRTFRGSQTDKRVSRLGQEGDRSAPRGHRRWKPCQRARDPHVSHALSAARARRHLRHRGPANRLLARVRRQPPGRPQPDHLDQRAEGLLSTG
jgi:hypothetical protein